MKNSVVKIALIISASLGFISNNSYAQNAKFLEIIYKKEVSLKVDTAKNNAHKVNLSAFNTSLADAVEDIRYSLKISNNNSVFKVVESLDNDSKNNTLKKAAISIGGTNGDFYINKQDSTAILNKTLLDANFRVLLKQKKWKIHKENKLIGKHLCYKATTIDTVNNSKGTHQFKVNVWFTTQLPPYFGPSAYCGLPGLILEVENGKMKLTATEVSIVKPFKIRKPKSGKLITEDEDSLNQIKAEKNIKEHFNDVFR
ncbi:MULTISPECIES: GLPGLI family protein [unclassified Cellulophaga]|uniref:GLPGLI family protein n=1 Tax=unclassified Cellulophaga TaxID=2634405 RepID=UPI0026E17E4F|nr:MULTISPECIES: GLPGLI family protein [unclassified Cellulophaga]MDO6490130.1 GLPGLI family protein [Cellulophaga sp. 2_MG-2023]MDO6494676.1 GLPGLI family protein [Cellulophaga sp. 3_MG-2023]